MGETHTRHVLDTGHWTLDTGHWTLDTGDWTLGTGQWTLDTGHWTLDTRGYYTHMDSTLDFSMEHLVRQTPGILEPVLTSNIIGFLLKALSRIQDSSPRGISFPTPLCARADPSARRVVHYMRAAFFPTLLVFAGSALVLDRSRQYPAIFFLFLYLL